MNMNRLYKFLSLIAVILAMAIAPSCTELEETLYTEIRSEDFYKTQEEVISALAPAYGDLRWLGDVFLLTTMNTDHTLIPTRGRHWYDGGHWQRMHEHTWTSETPQINGVWGYGFDRVNRANMLIYQLQQLDNIDTELRDRFIAELKMIRAFGYYHLIDFFGNVPIVDRFDVEPGYAPPNNTDFQAGRTAVFNFIEKDLLDNINNLSENVDRSTYGRFNKWTAHAMLAKLYINSEVWTGTGRWDDVIAHCDAIINSGNYQLEGNYFNNFTARNEGSQENIFVIPYDETRTDWGLIFFWWGHHYAMQRKFNTANGPWNGFCALPSHYKSFDEDDLRRNGWLVGKQYSSTGEPLICSEESAPNPLELTVDFTNIYDQSDNATYDHRNALEYHGARLVKWEITALPAWSMGNDFAVYRYADVLMLKAEALMRKNGGAATQEAVDLVNEVRARAFANPGGKLYTTETLDMDALLLERGWEFYFEAMRRNDLIRFGKFVRGEWEFFNRSNEGDYRNVMPIPQPRRNANPNLNQNPGY
jgi:starch-binding outer membrane protein, SusD/RagB family